MDLLAYDIVLMEKAPQLARNGLAFRQHDTHLGNGVVEELVRCSGRKSESVTLSRSCRDIPELSYVLRPDTQVFPLCDEDVDRCHNSRLEFVSFIGESENDAGAKQKRHQS